MGVSYTVFSSIFEPLLAFLIILLQLIALCTSWWAGFTARIDLGKPEENGHYGLWTLCSKKAPHWRIDCDPLDTFFDFPPFLTISAILCFIHLLLLVLFIHFGCIKLFHVLKNKANFCMKSKTLRIFEVAIAFLSTLIALMVAVFATVGENNQKEYVVAKGWSFWIQVAIILLDFALFALCSAEFFRFLRLQWQQQIDPEGKRAETYGNPSFDPDSPHLPRSQAPKNGAVAYTESSGYPYGLNPDTAKPNKTLTYENECYMESSPRAGRRQ